MIRQPGLAALKRVADALHHARAAQPWLFLSLSYQDVVATDAELAAVLGDAALELPVRPDSKEIVDWHKCPEITTKIRDWHELLRLLRFDPLSVDLVPARGCEQFLDLNQPPNPHHLGRYACVLDNVAHHCFDVGRALRSIAAMVRLGGYVLHVTPLNMVNHGFYTLNPTLLHDFYTANGYTVVEHVYYDVTRDGSPCVVHDVDPTRRMRGVPDNATQLFLTRRDAEVRPGVTPVQSKFVKHPESRIREGEER